MGSTLRLAAWTSDSVVVNRDVACDLNPELLDRMRVELDAFGRVGSDPVGDVILSQRH